MWLSIYYLVAKSRGELPVPGRATSSSCYAKTCTEPVLVEDAGASVTRLRDQGQGQASSSLVRNLSPTVADAVTVEQ